MATPTPAVERDLGKLVERLEAASEGSSELDWWIFLLATERGQFEFATPPENLKLPWPRWIENNPIKIWDQWEPRAYSRSLDAALTLIGDRWTDYSIEVCRAKFATPDPTPCCAWIADGDLNNPRTKQIAANAATAPLAVCLVALKALTQASPAPEVA